MHKLKSGIYEIRNLTTGKFYIGNASNIPKRFSQHKDDLRKNIHDNKYLQNAWNKYGEADFKFTILIFCEKEKLVELEQSWIDWTDCCNREKGYNINPNANSNLGFMFSDEARRNMSNAQRNNLNLNHLTKITALAAEVTKGKPRSEETKAKISKATIGRKLSKLHVSRVSISNREYARRKQAANVIGILSMGC